MNVVKVISQETFDQVVLENVVEFDQPLEEAITEAIGDFKAQGVELSNIIKQVSINEAKDKIIHPVLISLEVMQSATCDSSDTTEHSTSTSSPADATRATVALGDECLKSALETFIGECKKSIAHRLLAAKNEAYSHLIRLIGKAKVGHQDLVRAGVRCVGGLMDGNPDLLDGAGLELMYALMAAEGSPGGDPVAMEELAQWCHTCCVKHEKNRQRLFEAKIPGLLVDALKNIYTTPQTSSRACATLRALRAFTLDDDIRVPYGSTHDHCRHLVEEHGLVKASLALISGRGGGDSCLAEGVLATLSSVVVRTEYCQQALDAGALAVIHDIMTSFPDSALLNKQCLSLLGKICGNDFVKERVMKAGTGELIIRAMSIHQHHIGVCQTGCAAVAMLALRHTANSAQLLAHGAAPAIMTAMALHPKVTQLQKLACLAIRNLCCRSTQNAELLCLTGAEDAINVVMKEHHADPTVRDMATAALRDLGVDVKLKEQWLGRGHEIVQ